MVCLGTAQCTRALAVVAPPPACHLVGRGDLLSMLHDLARRLSWRVSTRARGGWPVKLVPAMLHMEPGEALYRAPDLRSCAGLCRRLPTLHGLHGRSRGRPTCRSPAGCRSYHRPRDRTHTKKKFLPGLIMLGTGRGSVTSGRFHDMRQRVCREITSTTLYNPKVASHGINAARESSQDLRGDRCSRA